MTGRTTAPAAAAAARPPLDSADARAVVCSWAGTFAPSGHRVGPAVDSVERLARMLTWATDNGRLTTVGTIAQVWVVGESAVDLLGWGVDPGEAINDSAEQLDMLREDCRARLTEAVARDLTTLERGGWRVRDGWETGGAWVRLQRIDPRERRGRGKGGKSPLVRVDVMLEPYAWTTPAPSGDENLGILGDDAAGWGLVDPIPDDATDDQVAAAEDQARAELGRRLSWCVEHLGVLPQITPSRTGAAIARQIWRAGKDRNADIEARDLDQHRSHVLTGPVPVPPLAHPPRGDLEPPMVWAAEQVDPAALEAADRLVVSDLFGSYLGSFNVPLPIGEPEHLDATAAAAALWESGTSPDKWPVGLWAVVFPGADAVPDWDVMPPAHLEWWHQVTKAPSSAVVADAVATVCTETLRGLAQTWTSGYGIDWCRDNLTLVEGWRWPHSAPALAKMQTTVGNALRVAEFARDQPMRKFVRAVYRSYAGALSNTPDQWGQWRAEHSTPVGQAQIRAEARWRARRKIDAVRRRTGQNPLTFVTDASAFLVPRRMDLAMFADPAPEPKPGRELTPAQRMPLGQLRLERWCTLTDTAREQLATARGHEQVAAAVAAAFKNSDRVEVCK
ncbi:hypothetical protein [Nocardia wallacei]|uniref:hypothetical protein n=1 Tax=Nocardia wallacei TaxID=480035 RepID=UPI002458931F|nr:hypothetical protein [Nocardia wallacei]